MRNREESDCELRVLSRELRVRDQTFPLPIFPSSAIRRRENHLGQAFFLRLDLLGMDELDRLYPLREPENRECLARIVAAAHARLCDAEHRRLFGTIAFSNPIRNGISHGKLTDKSETTIM